MAENIERNGEVVLEWREQHLADLIGQGYKIDSVVPAPVSMPVVVERRVEASDRYDYDSELRYEPTPIEKWQSFRYKMKMMGLSGLYGAANIQIAFPTPDMIAEHPEYAAQPYHILMIPTQPYEDTGEQVEFFSALGGPPILIGAGSIHEVADAIEAGQQLNAALIHPYGEGISPGTALTFGMLSQRLSSDTRQGATDALGRYGNAIQSGLIEQQRNIHGE